MKKITVCLLLFVSVSVEAKKNYIPAATLIYGVAENTVVIYKNTKSILKINFSKILTPGNAEKIVTDCKLVADVVYIPADQRIYGTLKNINCIVNGEFKYREIKGRLVDTNGSRGIPYQHEINKGEKISVIINEGFELAFD